MARVPSTDPGFPLNCPRCGALLVYVTSLQSAHVYTCDCHGEYQLADDGHLRGGVGPYGKPAARPRPN